MCGFSEVKLDEAQFSLRQNGVHEVFPTSYKDLQGKSNEIMHAKARLNCKTLVKYV